MKQTVEEAAYEYFQKAGFTSNPITDTFKSGAEWHAEQSPWISVKERKPSMSKEVVISHNREIFIGYLSYAMCNYWWNRTNVLNTDGEPVNDEDYWMPIPELNVKQISNEYN